jgi:hypothetical protein
VAYAAGRFEAAAHGNHSHPAKTAAISVESAARQAAIGTTGTAVTVYHRFLTVASVVSVELGSSDARC